MMEVLETLIKTLFKFVWKIFLILLWGGFKLIESIAKSIGDLIKNAIK